MKKSYIVPKMEVEDVVLDDVVLVIGSNDFLLPELGQEGDVAEAPTRSFEFTDMMEQLDSKLW